MTSYIYETLDEKGENLNNIQQKLISLNWTAYRLAKETGCKERMAYKLANGEASFTASLFCGLYLDKLIKEGKNV